MPQRHDLANSHDFINGYHEQPYSGIRPKVKSRISRRKKTSQLVCHAFA